jgi:hypothetical protein
MILILALSAAAVLSALAGLNDVAAGGAAAAIFLLLLQP